MRVFNSQGGFQARYSRQTELFGLAVFIGLCLCVGVSGSGLTAMNVHHWYLSLVRPPATPPNFLFGPVWAVLYITMAVAAWAIWRRPDLRGRDHPALLAWGGQLALNALWPPVFFGLHLLLAAFLLILALCAAIAWTIRRFFPLNAFAAVLLLPYLAWASFAAYLNAGFWWLNR